MTDKLKPCPFCGGEAIIHGYGFNQYSVGCSECWVETNRTAGVESAVKQWNIRKPMDRIVEEVNEIGRRVCNNVKCNHECVEDSERICDHGVLMGAVIDAIVKGVQNE